MKNYFALLRPIQWIKNLFIFAPLIFSRHLFETAFAVSAATGFAAFCLISSCVYIINDIFDRESDAAHPEKKNRPIASGKISIPAASMISFLLLLGAGGITLTLPLSFSGILFFYFFLVILYSIKLKQIVILDIFVIAAGFMLRVAAGAEVINVQISNWIILCTMFLSLFLAVGKRRGEIVLLKKSQIDFKRKVLEEYDPALIDQMMMIAATGTAISYALYTVAERTVKVFGTEYLIFTTIFVIFGIYRYLYLVMKKEMGESPVAIVLKDPPMFINLGLWFLTCVAIIYF